MFSTEYKQWIETGIPGIQAILGIGFEVFAGITFDYSIDSNFENSEIGFAPEVGTSINGTVGVQLLYGLAKATAVVSPTLTIVFDLEYSSVTGFSSDVNGEFEVAYNLIISFFWGLYEDDIIEDVMGPWSIGENEFVSSLKLDTTLILPQSIPYPNIRADAQGNLALIWISDKDTAQAQINPEVAFTYQPYGKDWIDPIDITSNDFFESSPDISFMNNGDLMAVWTQNNVTSSKAKSKSYSIYEILNAQDIFCAIYDTVTGWGTPSAIIEDAPGSLFSDGIPSVDFSETSQGLVLWTRSSDNVDPLAAGVMDIYYSVWNASEWSTPLVLIDDSKSNFEPVVRYSKTGNTAIAVWQTDVDGYPQTSDDNELAYSYWDGTSWTSASAITNNLLAEKNPTLATLSNGNFVCSWVEAEFDASGLHQEHRLYFSSWDYASQIWSTPEIIVSDSFLIEEPVINVDSRDIAGVVWKGHNGFDGDLFFSAKDMSDGSSVWTEPQLLTNDDLTDWIVSATIDIHNNVHFIDFKYDFKDTTSVIKGKGKGDFYDGLTLMSYGLKNNGFLDSTLNHGVYTILPDLYINNGNITRRIFNMYPCIICIRS